MFNIKELRCARKLTQKQLADAVGVHQTAVSQWEKGSASPTAAMIPKLLNVFECGISELYTVENRAGGTPNA